MMGRAVQSLRPPLKGAKQDLMLANHRKQVPVDQKSRGKRQLLNNTSEQIVEERLQSLKAAERRRMMNESAYGLSESKLRTG